MLSETILAAILPLIVVANSELIDQAAPVSSGPLMIDFSCANPLLSPHPCLDGGRWGNTLIGA